MRECSMSGCGRKHYGRGLCKTHYGQAWAKGEHVDHARALVKAGATLDERLRHHGWTVMKAGCWEWDGSKNSHGYGQLAAGLPNSRPEIASRAAYAAWVGPIPDGSLVCHRCDNPPCINPAHLFLGTKADNNRDMAQKRRTANGEHKSSHKLSDAQVDEIRALYATGKFSQRELGVRFGVSQQFVGLLAKGQRRARPTNRWATPEHS